MPALSIFVGVTSVVRCKVLRGEVVMGSRWWEGAMNADQ